MSPLRSRGVIFISYRREDSAPTAGRLHHYLSDRFGKDRVFMDVDSISIGRDFTKALIDALSNCNILLVLIGREWISTADDEGRRRIDHQDDWVRIEIETALGRNIQVVPVLVDGAAMPQAGDLPPSLRPFVQRQAFLLNNTNFESDVTGLVAAARKAFKSSAARTAKAPKGASRDSAREEGEWQLELVADRRFSKTFRLSSGTEAHQIAVRYSPIIEWIEVDGKTAVWTITRLHAKQYALTGLTSALGCAVDITVWQKNLRILEMNQLVIKIGNQVLTYRARNN